jgi:hypothetical protein
MNPTAVDEILDRINQLPEDDRELLDRRLTEQEELEWRRETEKAREVARRRGLDQAAIDRAVHAERYGE